MVSITPDECRERAAECQRQAENTTDEHARETLLYVASRWLALAELDEPEPWPNGGLKKRCPAPPE
jgi:hypothetical protein